MRKAAGRNVQHKQTDVMGLPFLTTIGENMNAHQLPLRRLNASLSVNLPPAAAEDIERGLRVELDALLLKHSYDFGGVVLAYEKEVVLSKRGVIGPYFPYLNLKARALLTVFQPKIGDMIVGTVNQVGNDYVGLLILGVLNASISSAQMGGRFSFKQGEWRANKGAGESIQVGCEVRFTVQGTHEQGDFFSISGSLAEAGTGPLLPREGAPKAAQAGAEDEEEESQDVNGANLFAPSEQPEPTLKLKDRKDKKEKKEKKAKLADVAEENGGKTEKKEKKSRSVDAADENGEKKKKKEKKGESADADEENAGKTEKKEKKSKTAKKEKKKDKEGVAEEKKKKKEKREAAAVDDGSDGKAPKKAKKQKK